MNGKMIRNCLKKDSLERIEGWLNENGLGKVEDKNKQDIFYLSDKYARTSPAISKSSSYPVLLDCPDGFFLLHHNSFTIYPKLYSTGSRSSVNDFDYHMNTTCSSSNINYRGLNVSPKGRISFTVNGYGLSDRSIKSFLHNNCFSSSSIQMNRLEIKCFPSSNFISSPFYSFLSSLPQLSAEDASSNKAYNICCKYQKWHIHLYRLDNQFSWGWNFEIQYRKRKIIEDSSYADAISEIVSFLQSWNILDYLIPYAEVVSFNGKRPSGLPIHFISETRNCQLVASVKQVLIHTLQSSDSLPHSAIVDHFYQYLLSVGKDNPKLASSMASRFVSDYADNLLVQYPLTDKELGRLKHKPLSKRSWKWIDNNQK